MPITWSRGYDQSESATRDLIEWEEHWNVLGFEPPVGVPAMDGLTANRPDLSPGQPHPVILGAYVEDFRADRVVNGADAWDVTVRYQRGREEIDYSIPPAQRPAEIDIEPESVEVPTFTQQDGTPWLNTAGDLIVDHTRTENHWIFTVKKNLAAVPSWILDYNDAVNNDTVTIGGLSLPQYTVLLKDLRVPLNPSTELVNGISYSFYPISFSLVYNRRTWKTKLLNRGLYQLTDGRHVPCFDDDHEPATEPMFLTEAGEMMVYPVNPNDIHVIEGWDHELLPFNALPLT